MNRIRFVISQRDLKVVGSTLTVLLVITAAVMVGIFVFSPAPKTTVDPCRTAVQTANQLNEAWHYWKEAKTPAVGKPVDDELRRRATVVNRAQDAFDEQSKACLGERPEGSDVPDVMHADAVVSDK